MFQIFNLLPPTTSKKLVFQLWGGLLLRLLGISQDGIPNITLIPWENEVCVCFGVQPHTAGKWLLFSPGSPHPEITKGWASTFAWCCWVRLQETKQLHQHQTPNQREEQYFIPCPALWKQDCYLAKKPEVIFTPLLRGTVRGHWVHILLYPELHLICQVFGRLMLSFDDGKKNTEKRTSKFHLCLSLYLQRCALCLARGKSSVSERWSQLAPFQENWLSAFLPSSTIGSTTVVVWN